MIEVQGNGTLVSREVQVSSFLRLHLAVKGSVELIQSNEEKVIIETDENLYDHIEVVNSGRTLYISSGEKLRRPAFTICKIKVYLRQINVLYMRSDGGDLLCKDMIRLTEPLDLKIQCVGNTSLFLDVPSISLVNQCQGNVSIRGKCGSIEIKNQGEGDLDLLDLEAGEVRCKNMADGNVELFAHKEISISHYGKGYVHYAGNAVLKDVKQYGSGLVKHIER